MAAEWVKRKVLPAASLMLVLSSLAPLFAEASPGRLVAAGREIAVAPVRSQPRGMFKRQQVSSVKVELPQELELRASHQQGNITVVGLPGNLSSQSAVPVPVNDADIALACEAIRSANPDISLRCEPNWLFSTARVPNDPRYSSLYGLTKIRLPSAWDFTVGSAQVIAAVLDSGVDYTHTDLESNILINRREVASNGIDDDGNGYIDDVRGYDFVDQDADPMDENGHGTHCAGIIGARGDNSSGVVGVNWRVGLLPVRVLNADGEGASSDIAAGIVYAVDRGASVINLSLGGPRASQIIEDAIQYALDRDVLVVAAAGNSGSDNDRSPVYPASSTKSNVIAVAASTTGDILAVFSNYGIESVDVAAPGQGILSTVPGNQYDVFDGTSMAAPHVTGLVALLKSIDEKRSAADLRDVILSTALVRVAMRERISTGARVDAAAAVQALAVVPTPTPSSTAPPSTPTPAPSGGVNPEPTKTPADNRSGEVARLTLRRLLRKTTATLFGNAFDTGAKGLGGQLVSLNCSGKQMASYTTLGDGAFIFQIKRTRKALQCQSSTLSGVVSSVVRIPKR